MAITGRKRPRTGLTEPTTEPPKRRSRNKPVTTHGAALSTADASGCVATTFRMPSNPRATLSGLPAELRLEIYSYLCNSSIIHVHHHGNQAEGTSRFTWTPCRAPSSASPLLCANPKWSGMCDEEDRCTYKIETPPKPMGFWALAASNKFMHEEMQHFFLRKTVVSIHARDLRPWLDHVGEKNPRQIDNLRRVTLAGPNTYRWFDNEVFDLLRDRIPKLESVGVQCQDPVWRWRRCNDEYPVDREAWKKWNIPDLVKGFDSSLTIALETMLWWKPGPNCPLDVREQQVVVRVIRPGKLAEGDSDSGWADEDVHVEYIRPGNLHSRKRNAGWRQWWQGMDARWTI